MIKVLIKNENVHTNQNTYPETGSKLSHVGCCSDACEVNPAALRSLIQSICGVSLHRRYCIDQEIDKSSHSLLFLEFLSPPCRDLW